MLERYDEVCESLRVAPRRWLVTGAAGFIGSNLVERLLRLNQTVIGLDNFATGHRRNLDEVVAVVGTEQAARFHFIEGDIRSLDTCRAAVADADVVLHQAALGSVPRSLADPLATHASNIDGFLNMLVAARDAGVKRFVYAASSSTYGDHPALPKREDVIGKPLSPYAVTKLVNELYADVFGRCYGMSSIGLRYFNVFGPRQDPDGAYAAVIPRWVSAMLNGKPVTIHGDGETTRDFCFVDNAVQANILAATADKAAENHVYNVAVSGRTSLNELHSKLAALIEQHTGKDVSAPVYGPFRAGDVRHSQADIERAQRLLGYHPSHDIDQGLQAAIGWYLDHSVLAAVPG